MAVDLADVADDGERSPLPPIRIVVAVIANPAGQVLLVRKRGSDTFIQPGGKPEPGEAPLAALARELFEELGLQLRADTAIGLGRFEHWAVNEPGRRVQAQAWACQVAGAPVAAAEIAELIWLDPLLPFPVPVAPLSATAILPAWRAQVAGARRGPWR
ncbi:MAG: NUDIX domain-containing protein, partial [Lysobacterales bacterium]